MGELSDFHVGQTVELQDGRIATVQFIGNTHFAAGDWIGVELDDASGKNDGAVQGQRYFDCTPGHGMFVRPAAANSIDEPTPKPVGRTTGKLDRMASKARPEDATVGVLRRQSVVETTTTRRQSTNAGSPTPRGKIGTGSMASRVLQSPSKSPTKQLALGNALGANTSSTARKPSTMTAKTSRPSIGPPSTHLSALNPKASHPPIIKNLNGSAEAARQPSITSSRAPSHRLSLQSGSTRRLGSISGESHASAGSGLDSLAESLEQEEAPAPKLSPPNVELRDDQSRGTLDSSLSFISAGSRFISSPKPTSSRERSPPTTLQRPMTTGSAAHREVEDLKIKLRILERKRMEDREKLKAMDRIQAERDKFEGIIQKLQSKYQPQQQEVVELRRRLKEEQAKLDATENQQAENETVVEMATLDREMAEQMSESLKTELDLLRQKHEELALEAEILREENQELGKEMSPDEKSTQGWLQLERSNDRLREALTRLRDVSQQQESELKSQVKELEKDVQDLGIIKEQYSETKRKLAQADAAVEDLKLQLDTALGGEEMIEELTEKNLLLNEQLDNLRATIEDLESLKELNDELELNHIENENQMQEEIDGNRTIAATQENKLVTQSEKIEDLEYTITRFRDLVTNMQSDLENMRTSQQITETEASELSNRSRAILDMNMRLQVSASKAQAKAIDLELERMRAQEVTDHLAIVQLFLPESFKKEGDSVLALLRFKRVSFKARLMHDLIKERVNGTPSPGHEDDMFTCCDILEKLTWVTATCDRFINFVQTSTLEAFRKIQGALYDLEPVERSFNGWIDGLKKDNFEEQHCVSELQRSIALMIHLAEIHIHESLEHFAGRVYMHALMMQSHFENAAAALLHAISMVESRTLVSSSDESEDDQKWRDFLDKAHALTTRIRGSTHMTSKAIHNLEELKSRSLTLEPATLPSVEMSTNLASDLALVTRNIGLSIFNLFNEEGRATPFTYQDVYQIVSSTDTIPFPTISTQLQKTNAQLRQFCDLASSLTRTIEIPSRDDTPPWQLLAQNLHDATITSAAHETEMGKFKDDLIEKRTAIAMREKVIDELGVKVEVLEKRAEESGGRREKIRELEDIVEIAKSREKELVVKVASLRQDLRRLEDEQRSLKKPTNALLTPESGDSLSTNTLNATPEASLRQVSKLNAEIASLQSSIRYLRASAHSKNLSSSHSFLSTPLIPATVPSNPLQSEAKGVLEEMLHLITRSENEMVQLQQRDRSQRLKWRPAKETCEWTVQRQKEEWEEWREWRDGVSRKVGQEKREGERRAMIREKVEGRKVLAKVQIRLPGLGGYGKGLEGGEVKIVRAEEWEDVEERLGIGIGI